MSWWRRPREDWMPGGREEGERELREEVEEGERWEEIRQIPEVRRLWRAAAVFNAAVAGEEEETEGEVFLARNETSHSRRRASAEELRGSANITATAAAPRPRAARRGLCIRRDDGTVRNPCAEAVVAYIRK
ncbi:hypothetical protein TrST_g386 [Triparma strigata]|uniref:Uncharacterized protein n=1 Tax=Triparma strigata TaxID=1606541 RepID=A0A9W7A1B2_9STRA|nr:hypothetical protein TrST_g386 [Triparma strigata]